MTNRTTSGRVPGYHGGDGIAKVIATGTESPHIMVDRKEAKEKKQTDRK